MARRRRSAAPLVEMEPPQWLWQFRRSDPQWRREGDGGPDADWARAEVRARARWSAAAQEWLDERDLALWPYFRGTWQEFKRVER
ncbi:MAG TPA: hypothetical protein VFP69_20095, partial [Streptomyces sp.]|nr:hypothetical protein [Streptomyces sp.]